MRPEASWTASSSATLPERREEDLSKAERFARLPKEIQEQFLSELTDDQLLRLVHDWDFLGRPSQLPPDGDWDVWLVNAGRGFGKTRTGAEMVNKWAEKIPYIALVGRTAADVRDVMILGDAGIMATAKPWFRPVHYPGRSCVIWPNGAIAKSYSAEKPESLRGPSFNAAWCDEIAVWRTPKGNSAAEAAWDMLQFGMRVKEDISGKPWRPRQILTTTPKNVPLVKKLLALAADLDELDGRMSSEEVAKRLAMRNGAALKPPYLKVRMTTGSSYDNWANLAESYVTSVIGQYIGTRLEIQEVYAKLVADDPNALWRRDRIEALRVTYPPSMQRLCVAVDPSGSIGEAANECGIVVAGQGEDGHGYLIADYSGKMTPAEWGRMALELYYESGANAIVAEKNYGGAMVEHTIRSMVKEGEEQPFIEMVTATKGKVLRAQPISALVQKDPGQIHHVGSFPELEDELCTWVPGEKSPNRLDAMVWAFYWLLVRPQEKRLGVHYDIQVTGR